MLSETSGGEHWVVANSFVTTIRQPTFAPLPKCFWRIVGSGNQHETLESKGLLQPFENLNFDHWGFESAILHGCFSNVTHCTFVKSFGDITGTSTWWHSGRRIATDNGRSERGYTHEQTVQRLSAICRQRLLLPAIAAEVFRVHGKWTEVIQQILTWLDVSHNIHSQSKRKKLTRNANKESGTLKVTP